MNPKDFASKLDLSETRAEQELRWIKEFALKNKTDEASLIQDRLSGRPLAYILKEWDFFGRTFYIDENVLIPRPETEQLVEFVLKNEKLSDYDCIVDVGTGSGVIGITLALEYSHQKIICADISQAALLVAKKNALNLNAKNCEFVESDLLENISLGTKNLIIANLPYIPTVENVDNSVKDYEPHLALFGGKDGLLYIHQLLDQLKNKNFHAWLEIHESHVDKIKHKNVQYLKSLQKDYRFAFLKS